MIPDGLNAIFKFIEDNDDDADFNVALATFVYETDDGDEIEYILKAIEETYKENSEELKKEIILSLKDKPELRNRLDIRSTLRLSRYEGSASNVLRDIMMTSNSMIQEIISKRVILQESIETFQTDNQQSLMNVLKAIEETYNENSEELKKEIMLSLKDKPELKSKLDIRSTLRLSRYEGSASNVLRDILLTSSSMIQEINNKRVILQESIKQDDKIVSTIKKDNTLIVKYLKELSDMEEIKKIYLESFEKVVENMGKINSFVNEL